MRQFSVERKEAWWWTMMIMQPEVVTMAYFERVLEQMRRKKGSSALAQLRLEPFHEGLAAQIMHLGPYAVEEATIARLHTFIIAARYNSIFVPSTSKNLAIQAG